MRNQFVISKKGHDKGCVYIVVKQENNFCFVADGKYKTLEKLKKKNIIHLQPMNRFVEFEGELTNEYIKYSIKEYLRNKD